MPEPVDATVVDATSHTVVVLNWHGRRDTIACVQSLLDDADPPRVLVVDNGSHDGTLEEVERRWPAATTLQTGENLGFAGGMNRGITAALDAGARCITVLNNDTTVPAGTMAALRAVATDAIAVSPVIHYRDEPDRVWFAGGTLRAPRWLPHHTPPERLAPPVDGLRDADVLSGCCVTASREVWQRVGGFDEGYFLNFEDSEWSIRARREGVRLAVAADARIDHAVSASFTGASASLGTYYYVRNGLRFNRAAGGSALSRALLVADAARHGAARARRAGGWTGARRELAMVAAGVRGYREGAAGPAPHALADRARTWSDEARARP